MDSKIVEAAVHSAVLEVAQHRHPTLTTVGAEDTLAMSLGLKSLDLAFIVSLLEGKLTVDPFAELVPITQMRTVGDLVSAYQLAFREQKNGVPTPRGWEGEEPPSRGTSRLQILAGRESRRPKSG